MSKQETAAQPTTTNPSLDSAVVLSFSLVSALFIALVPIITAIYKGSLSSNLIYVIYFAILPIITYGMTAIFNVFIQLIRCGSVNAQQVLMNAFPSVALVAIFGALSTFIGFLRIPVESLLPSVFDLDMKKGIAVSFFIFWGAVYGQALGGSLSQSCVSSTPGGSGPK
jgi:hypothetical protein